MYISVTKYQLGALTLVKDYQHTFILKMCHACMYVHTCVRLHSSTFLEYDGEKLQEAPPP